MSSDIAIKVENLSKCYHVYDKPRDRLLQMLGRGRKQYFREFWAVRDVSLEINKGDTVGIIGRNGSGKSTLLQMICGTLNPTSGQIQSNGRIAALLELGSGFNPEFTGRENVLLNAAVLGVGSDEMAEKIDRVIDFAGLGDYIDQPLKTYSSGMYARLAFSAAIHVEPAILIVDEALSVGDAGFQLKCMLRMRELQEQGMTILFVSHDTGAVIRLCDHAIVLDQGRIVSQDMNPLKCVKLYEQLTRKIALPDDSLKRDRTVQPVTYGDELQGMVETRLGSQDASYLGVEFLGDDGQPRHVFRSGEEIQIRATISSVRAFGHVASGFTLKNRAGVDVWGDNTFFAGMNISLDRGVSYLTYRFRLNIPAGDYFLYIGLADVSGERVELDQRWPVRRLSVVSNRQCLGYSYSPASIEITTLNHDA